MQEEINLSSEKGWYEKIKDTVYENWQTILVAFIVIIIGVVAYNNNKNVPTEENESAIVEQQGNQEEQEENNHENNSEDSNNEEEVAEKIDEEEAQKNDEEAEIKNEEAEVIEETSNEESSNVESEEESSNENVNTGDGYEIEAQKGEGLTHLARKAMEAYLKDNRDDSITALHKIYIEDYMQNSKGSYEIEIGHKEFFSKSLVQEAIESSKNLSENSLENLKKYSA